MLEKLTAGDNIASYCTKCKMVLDHVIIALDGETAGRVKCRTCGSAHKYRSGADVKPARTKKTNHAAKTAEALWEACIFEAKGRERAYNMTLKYRIGDIVLHDTFGKGVVRKLYCNKCDVLFRDKERLMASSN